MSRTQRCREPLIDVYKTGDPAVHLSRAPSGAFVVDCPVLAQDLKDAYFRDIRPGLSGALRATMQARLNDMARKYLAQSDAQKPIIAGAPPTAFNAGSTASGGTFIDVNSPAPPLSTGKP